MRRSETGGTTSLPIGIDRQRAGLLPFIADDHVAVWKEGDAFGLGMPVLRQLVLRDDAALRRDFGNTLPFGSQNKEGARKGMSFNARWAKVLAPGLVVEAFLIK